MIKQYTVMSKTTNQPVRYCQCLDSDKNLIVGEDEYIVEGRQESTQKPEDILNNIRISRDLILASSDWTQLPDAQVDKQAWADYRQALRDLPNQYQNVTDLSDVVWPQPPVI